MVAERALVLLAVLALALPVIAQSPAPVEVSVSVPAVAESVDLAALQALEERVTRLVPAMVAATVGLRFEGGQGSGVIISADGYVLTAAHIFDDPGKDITLILHDGRRLEGKTLGRQEEADFALLKIAGEGPYPWAEMGSTKKLSEGTIVLSTGHPGGFRTARPPVLRLGQVTSLDGPFMETSCIIDRGDSGGPVWDLDGKVVGIHSRIQIRPRSNFHIAVDKYRDTWERLLAGESWGNKPRGAAARFDSGPRIGVRVFPNDDGALVDRVFDELPGAKAGLRKGDVITTLDGVKISGPESLVAEIRKHEPGDEITLEVVRTVTADDEKKTENLKIVVTLDRAP